METASTPLDDEVTKEILSFCSGDMSPAKERMVLSGMVAAEVYVPHAQRILDFEVREDDIWLLGHPRNGTTWTQEMVWLINNNFNFEKAKSRHIMARFPTLLCLPGKVRNMSTDLIEFAKHIDSPRYIKTHEHKPLLPKQLWSKKPKIIFLCRNPKGAAVSLYHYYKLLYHYKGPMDLILKAFMEDKILCNPFWSYVLDFWALRHEPNVLFLIYDKMQKDLPAAIKQVADFLDVRYTKEQETALVEHLSISNMRSNPTLNMALELQEMKANTEEESFIRKGEPGGWRREMSEEMVQLFDEWIQRNLEGSDFPRDFL